MNMPVASSSNGGVASLNGLFGTVNVFPGTGLSSNQSGQNITFNISTVGTGNGGTGLTSLGSANQILGVNTAGTALEYKTLTAGTNVTITPAAGSLTIAASGAGGGMTNPMTTLGDLIYEDATPTAVRLAGNTTSTKKFLVQTGTGTVSAAPSWGTIAAGDVPTLNQNTTGTAANVTGTVAIANGGTGQTSQQAAIDALLPSQASNSGKFLTTNGTTSSWGTPAGGGGSNGNTVTYLFKAHGSSVSLAQSFTLIDFGTVDYDPHSNYTNTAGNYKYTVPAAGYYLVQANLGLADSSASAQWVIFRLYANGSFIGTERFEANYADSNQDAYSYSSMLKFSLNDFVQVYAERINASPTTAMSYGSFAMTFISS